MASRSHVDVNERRLRPIYDCLDNGNNRKAIQEADKVLKKQKNLTCAKVLKALALLRMGRHPEGSAILAEIHSAEPTEEQTLNAMSICYKEMQQYKKIVSLYDGAAKNQPNNEDILSCLFMAHVRLGNYQQQQRTAMLLHKLRPNKNPYYFWAVMSIVMQAHVDKKLGKTMYLPLAERMTDKYIQEERIEAEAEILLYLIILELQDKWEEALAVLEGSLGAQLGNELNIRQRRLAKVCTQLARWDKVNSIYKGLLNVTPDDWTFWLKYLESGFNLMDSGSNESTEGKEEKEEDSPVQPDGSPQLMQAYIEQTIEASRQEVFLRGPFMAQLEFLRYLGKRQDPSLQNAKKAYLLLQEYFEMFGHKSCCYGDMKMFVDLLNEEELDLLLKNMKAFVDLEPDNGSIKYAKDVKQLTRHLVYLQLCRFTGRHSSLSNDELLELSKELLRHQKEGLKFGHDLLPTDLQHSDNYLLLAVHLLLDVWKRTGDDVYLWRAIVHLEVGIRESASNFQFKLLLIQLYCVKGVFGPCPALYDSMEIKHIMNDTMGHIVSNHVVRLGHFVEAATMYATMVRFFVLNQKEASEHLMSSYKFGSFGRIQEFVEFQDQLDNSLQYHSANVEKMLLDLIMQTDRHDSTESTVEFMDRSSSKHNKLDLQSIRDNRDLSIALSWDPASQLQSLEKKDSSLQEEKAWLQLRWLQLKLFLSAVCAGHNCGGPTAVVNGNKQEVEEDNDKENSFAVMKEKEKELREFADKCKDFVEPRQYNLLQGPFRTRISTYLCSPHLDLISAMVHCIEYSQRVKNDGIENQDPQGERCWKEVEDLASKLIVKDVEGLLKDINGRRQLDSTALEQLVASVESISYVTLLTGVCNRFLKPLKSVWSKKSKKNKNTTNTQPSTFENFNHLVKELSSVTKELHQIASGLDPVFSALDTTSFRLADFPEEEEYNREAERLVWNKVESSVQQSSREICEVLHHKQYYLNTLLL